MAVDVPPRAGVTQEALLLVLIEALPQQMAVWPQTVDRSTPADLAAAAPQPAQELANAAAGDLILLNRRWVEIGMGARGKAAPGKSNDLALMPGSIEREDEIDHRQACPDQQRGVASLSQITHCCASVFTPRIANEPIADAGESAQRLRFLVPDGEHQHHGL